MQITIQAIITNLISAQSDELMQKHLSDERLPSVWNTFLICRLLSYSPLGAELSSALSIVSNVKDAKVGYPLLMAICRKNKQEGRLNSPAQYQPSPFVD